MTLLIEQKAKDIEQIIKKNFLTCFALEEHIADNLPVLGIDEAGMGAWAGPLYVAGVILPRPRKAWLYTVRDSKLLTELQRERAARDILQNAVAWTIVAIDSVTVDNIGIYGAQTMGIQRVCSIIEQKYKGISVLIDGNRLKKAHSVLNDSYYFIPHGDNLSVTIAAASILAKVFRDRHMKRLGKKYPIYGFAEHKGYGVDQHRQALYRFGPCPEHRMSYKPIKYSVS